MSTIRYMEIEDIEQVLAIEHASFAIPWSYDSFYNEVKNNPFACYLVIELDEKVIGYCGVWVVYDNASITNIAVLPEFRGHQYGKAMLQRAISLAQEKGADSISLEVRISNLVAKGLYEGLGFQSGGIRKGYYTDNNEDALVMWRKI